MEDIKKTETVLEEPKLEEAPILEVRHLKQFFRFNGASGPNKYLKAVHDVREAGIYDESVVIRANT